jgi:hypothetical protein
MYYTPNFLHNLHLHFIPVWILYLQPLLYFLNNLVSTFKLFLRDGIFEGLKVVERVQDLSYMVSGEEQSIQTSCLLPVFSFLFVFMFMLKEDLQNIFVWSYTPEMILQGFKSLNMQVWVNGMTTKIACLYPYKEESWLSLLKM